MAKSNRHYDKPLVPEYMTRLTIDKLPFDTAYYVNPGEQDDFGPPKLFVTQDRQLKMACAQPISPEDTEPNTPLGLVGVMRVMVYSGEGDDKDVHEAYIADLRFIDFHGLINTDETAEGVDERIRDEALTYLNNSIAFHGFIAPEYDPDSDDDIPKAVYYGPGNLRDHLKALKKQGNRAMKAFVRVNEVKEANIGKSEPALEETTSPEEKVGSKALDCAVVFIEPRY